MELLHQKGVDHAIRWRKQGDKSKINQNIGDKIGDRGKGLNRLFEPFAADLI